MGKRNNNNTTEMIMWANSFSRYIRLSIGARKMCDRPTECAINNAYALAYSR